jgi:hypothetical protein
MVDEMLALIQNNGGLMPLETWIEQVRAAGLRPDLLQRMKRQGLVHTTRVDGEHSVIRLGAKPAPAPTE